MAAEQRVHPRSQAVIGHELEFQAGRLLDHCREDMAGRAERGADRDLARPLLGVVGEFLPVLPGRLGACGQHRGRRRDQADRLEVAVFDVTDARVEGQVDIVVHRVDRIAVGRRGLGLARAVVPDAPPTLATTTGWPRCFWNSTANGRKILSVSPPAAHGTIILMGRSGYCAIAGADKTDQHPGQRGSAGHRQERPCHASSPCFVSWAIQALDRDNSSRATQGKVLRRLAISALYSREVAQRPHRLWRSGGGRRVDSNCAGGPRPHHARRLLAIREKTTASADVAVYIVKAFRYPIIIAWRRISFATLASPGTVSKSHAPVMPGIVSARL